jgi:aspartyl-tRNA(Asn)/glutamyl-tRNA(Gln) amidotransferase subunit B
VVVELLGALNKANLEIDHCPVPAEQLGQLVLRITDNTISSKIAKTVFEAMMNGQGTPDQIIESQGLRQVTDSGAIETMIDEIIAQFPEQLAEYRSGKDKLFAFFVGQAMKASKGKANPGQLNEMLKEKLK